MLQHLPYNPLIADIWSLGICFFTLLNDTLPFNEEDDFIMLDKQLSKNWSFRPNIENKLSVKIKDIIQQMLEPNTELRLNSQTLIDNQWFEDYYKFKTVI